MTSRFAKTCCVCKSWLPVKSSCTGSPAPGTISTPYACGCVMFASWHKRTFVTSVSNWNVSRSGETDWTATRRSRTLERSFTSVIVLLASETPVASIDERLLMSRIKGPARRSGATTNGSCKSEGSYISHTWMRRQTQH